ncbi:hypothetical protein OAM67_01130 [bacterium]|nr:hypothetical protein [bacterium]
MERVRAIYHKLAQLKKAFLKQDKEYLRVIRKLHHQARAIEVNGDNYEYDQNNVARMKADVKTEYNKLYNQKDKERKKQCDLVDNYHKQQARLMDKLMEAWDQVQGCDVRDTIDYFLNKSY